MSFRGRSGPGRGAGGFRGGGRGAGGSYRSRGGGGGFSKGGKGYDQGPPETVTPLGHLAWTVQDDLVLKVDIDQVPFFNAPIYTEQKQQVGKIDEIFGNIRDHYVSVKLSENIKAPSFEKDTQLYIDVTKLLPLQRFLPKPPGEKRGGAGRGMRRGGRGRGGGGGGGGRGSFGGRASFGRGGGFNNRGSSGGFRSRGGNNSFNRNHSGGRGGGRGKW